MKSLPKWLIASRVGVFEEDLQDGVRGTLVPPEDPACARRSDDTRALAALPADRAHDRRGLGEHPARQTRNVYAESVSAREQRA